jgi:membrane-bound inhibitor of C-type lysozyme
MFQKRLSLIVLLCIPLLVQAQSAAAPTAGQVEISRTKVSDIPSQYRADAAKPRKPFAVRYTCPDAGRVYVMFDNAQETATLEMGNTTRYLKQGKSGSGARYVNSDESYVFWVKGNEATINGRETCVAD